MAKAYLLGVSTRGIDELVQTLQVDTEGRRLFGVERAEPHERATAPAQRDALAHELDDVDAVLDEVEVAGR